MFINDLWHLAVHIYKQPGRCVVSAENIEYVLIDVAAYLIIQIGIFVDFDALAQASDFRIERRQVVFCWIQDSKLGSLRHQIASRLNAHSQTDWAIEDQAKTFTNMD